MTLDQIQNTLRGRVKITEGDMSGNSDPPVWPAGGMGPSNEDSGDSHSSGQRHAVDTNDDSLRRMVAVLLEHEMVPQAEANRLAKLLFRAPKAADNVIEDLLKGAECFQQLQALQAAGKFFDDETFAALLEAMEKK